MIQKEIDPNILRQNIKYLEKLEYKPVVEFDEHESITPTTNKGHLTSDSKKYFFEDVSKKLQELKEQNEKVEKFYTEVQGNFQDQEDLSKFLTLQEEELNKLISDTIFVKKYQYKESKTSKVLRIGINSLNKPLKEWIEKEYNPLIKKEQIIQVSDVASILSKSIKHKDPKEEEILKEKDTKFQEFKLKAVKQITPIEKSIVQQGIDYLDGTMDKTVLVDLFARHSKDGKYAINYIDKGVDYKSGHIKYTKDGNIESHTVVLCKENNKYLIIDPNNAEFSAILIGAHNDIRVCLSKKFQVYQPIENAEEQGLLGLKPYQWRDCIDIAVKLAFNLNKNNQKIELETFNKSEVIKTDSLKNNISIQEITNNPDILNKIPEELKYYPVRVKQSSNLTDQKIITEALKVFSYQYNKVEKLIEETGLSYINKKVEQKKDSYFETNYTTDKYDESYNDLFEICKYIKNIDEIELLGQSTKLIMEEFNEV